MLLHHVLRVPIIPAQTNFHLRESALEFERVRLHGCARIVEHKGRIDGHSKAPKLLPYVQCLHVLHAHQPDHPWFVLEAEVEHSLRQFVRNVRSGVQGMKSSELR